MRGTIVGWAAFVAAVVVLVPAIVIGGSALLMDQLQQRDSAGESDEPYAQAAPDSPTDPAPTRSAR
ncbi:hypothetical protein [Nesterenkonia sp. NBAIMH1]|uniref:hypothetical protein n=1 Tax=Nesterenkonia sp. NBAIMH1 TaxID=2600320 RepID=UPI0011B5E7D5|nr:hypothetical protein [Nesterenkonia sp. NBAIMH1]